MPDNVERQLKFAADLYGEEDARRRSLDERGKNLLSLSTLYSGFIVLVLKDHPHHTLSEQVLIVAAIAAMSAAFALAVRGAAIRKFTRPFHTKEMIADFDNPVLSDDDLLANRMAGYMAAYDANCEVNTQKARYLSYSEWLILFGIVLHASSAIIML